MIEKMTIDELFEELQSAYSNDNLTAITSKLIALYQAKNYSTIRELAHRALNGNLGEANNARCFSKLMLCYHPDRGELFRAELTGIYKKKDIDRLKEYSHILHIHDAINASPSAVDEDLGYEVEYVWDSAEGAGYSFSESVPVGHREKHGEGSRMGRYRYERSFYNLIKLRVYGTLDQEFPPYYLEDFQEMEMAYSGLESLDGIEYCAQLKIADLSNNALTDISPLWQLADLEELYLSNNEIGYIDALSNLVKLKTLDLSYNQIDDLSPILDLDCLEFVNLLGNPVSALEIAQLENKGVTVIYGNQSGR